MFINSFSCIKLLKEEILCLIIMHISDYNKHAQRSYEPKSVEGDYNSFYFLFNKHETLAKYFINVMHLIILKSITNPTTKLYNFRK